MIRGIVHAGTEAIVGLRLRGQDRTEQDVDAVIDTGFTGFLTLPADIVVSLGLELQSDMIASLADGSTRQFETYSAEVEWDGNWRHVLVWALGDYVLLGMELLAGYSLRVDVVAGGAVEIAPLP